MIHQRQGRQLLYQYGYFFLFWFIIQVFINVPVNNLSTGWTQEIIIDSVKLVGWLVVGLVLIRRTKPEALAVQQPFKVNWRFSPLYITLGLMLVYVLGVTLIQKQQLQIQSTFTPEKLGQDFLVVGICEETLFRGYFLNRIRPLVDNQQMALVIQAVLFALIHLPRYLTTYPALSLMTIVSQLITVGLLGYLFGWLFLKSRSLWPGIIAHSVWDLLIVMFVGS
ncbi:immunity protein PlnI [Secundilactobacillus odoratitofui DSM 19909 = JCM 15043]|uniref:Immunity protein PlnI n=1 Tax=Secundilactobacillus odoratitofui DSM 19909 = JCM 15043 TaxID=1423776 RepID=A0A0R1M0G6_9LACO|nr:CPBP family intramembrane glutamic endopeptidase [Secundilactobacillus odoratitofui]KRK98050.1 immunity protein PlnI [Secundilactobacillus odoratitofui DSM 19909 = JCM 15043]